MFSSCFRWNVWWFCGKDFLFFISKASVTVWFSVFHFNFVFDVSNSVLFDDFEMILMFQISFCDEISHSNQFIFNQTNDCAILISQFYSPNLVDVHFYDRRVFWCVDLILCSNFDKQLMFNSNILCISNHSRCLSVFDISQSNCPIQFQSAFEEQDEIMINICRYNSFTNQLRLILNVLWLYFNQSLIFLKMCCTSISMYLFHISVHIGFIQVRTQFQVYVKLKRMKEFNSIYRQECRIYCIKLAPSSIGLSFCIRFFGIELAYSHSVGIRLLYGLISINPIKSIRSNFFKR